MSNPASNQQRSLKPTGTIPSTYSASPSQLTLSSDIPANSLANPYQPQYGFPPNPHDPAAYAFPPPQHPYHPPQLQTQLNPGPPHQQQQAPQPPQQQHPQQPKPSPGATRKRRASDVENHGPPNPNATFAMQQGVDGASGSVPDGGMNRHQTNPAPKKGRTNTPWTPAEEQRLKTMRDAGNSWSEIAKTFPTRTEGSVKKHWYKDMHYAEFAEDESAALMNAIKDYESQKWKVIGAKLGKPAKACEQFAKEQGWKV